MKTVKLTTLLHLGALILVFLLVYPMIFDEKIALLGDNANYFILAKGLANGQGYVNYHTSLMTPANHFPPGYSFTMSLFMRLGIESIVAMKILNGFILLFSSMLFYGIVKRISKNGMIALLLALVVLMNKHLLGYSTIIMSEVMYMFYLLASVYCFIRAREVSFHLKSPWFYLLLISMLLTVFTRTQGIVVIGAFLFYLLLFKQWKVAGISFIVVFLALLPWQMRSANLGGSTYMKQVMRVEPYNNDSPSMSSGDWMERIGENFNRYLGKEIPSSMIPIIEVTYKDTQTGKNVPIKPVHYVIGVITVLLSLVGIWFTKEYRWFFLPLFGAAFLIFLLWPQVWYGNRFFMPLIPLTLFFSVAGIYHLVKLAWKKMETTYPTNWMQFAPALFVFVLIAPIKSLQEKANTPHPKNWENFLSMSEWAKDNLPKGSIIASRKPALTYMMCEHKTAGFPYTSDKVEFLKEFKKSEATHVIVEQLGFSQTIKFLAPMVNSDKDKFHLIYSLGAKVRKDKDGNQIPPKAGAWMVEFNDSLGYNGPIVDNLKNGKGSYRFYNGALINGTWVNDTLNGPGVLYAVNGMIYEGNWVNGKKEGRFYITNPKENAMVESYWVKDSLLQEGYIVDAQHNRLGQTRLR